MSRRWVWLALLATCCGFALLHALGARSLVSVLSGTLPATELELCAGLAYAAAWFAVVLAVPVVALALVLDRAYGKMRTAVHQWRASRRR